VRETAESWFDKVEPWFDRVLECVEVLMVLALGAGILTATLFEVIWTFHGDPCGRHLHLEAALKTLNENWKAGLLLIVPLFYRTVRGFLERVEEFAGAKAPRKPKSTLGETPNPPEPTQPAQNPEDQPEEQPEARN
jgi:hypothetical protein